MTQFSNPSEGPAKESAPSTPTALVMRVLAQFSLNAWLPAFLLAVSLTVLLNLKRIESTDVLTAVHEMVQSRVETLTLLVLLLVLSALLLEAFASPMMRLIEGYWGHRGPLRIVQRVLIQHQVRRRINLEKELDQMEREMFESARDRMLKDGVPRESVDREEDVLMGLNKHTYPDFDDPYLHLDWHNWCDPWDLGTWDSLRVRYWEFPTTNRLLATRMGNILRAAEDSLSLEHDLRDTVTVSQGSAPEMRDLLNRSHDRMEVYVALIFVSAGLTVATPSIMGTTWNAAPIALVAITTFFAGLCIASYSAALTSTRTYCIALQNIGTSDSDPRPVND